MKTNNNIPAYRFQGFEDDWEEVKLREVSNRVTRKNKELISSLPLTISAQHGLVDQEEFFYKQIASKDVSNYYLVKNGEFAYNKSYSNGYPWGAIKRLDRYEMGVLSTLYIVFKPTNSICSDFLVSYYDSSNWYKEVSMVAAEGARNHGLLNIAPNDFFETRLSLPSIPEQEAIGTFFSTLDRQITLHQRKLDTLKEQKKTYLKLLFPAKGQTQPALRFQGFEDDWEEVKLGEVCTIQGGNAWKSDSYSLTGEYLVVTIANVTGEYFIADKKGNRIDINPNEMQYVLKKGDILISLTGNVGRVSKMTESKGVLNQRVGKLTTTANFEFIFSILRTEKFENEMRLASQGAAQANISN
ncbi:TPA: restriction endonuclease subunit S, partial [Streptococcus suis]|nr:restriction endonuclease subunit S [Streptococcus suis]